MEKKINSEPKSSKFLNFLRNFNKKDSFKSVLSSIISIILGLIIGLLAMIIICALKEDLSIDFDGVEKLVQHLIDNGSDAVLVASLLR